MERSQANLLEAQEMIRRLEEQLKQLQAAKEELEKRQNELQAMMERLEESKNMEAAERQKLEDEIKAKQVEVQRIQEEVSNFFFVNSYIFSFTEIILSEYQACQVLPWLKTLIRSKYVSRKTKVKTFCKVKEKLMLKNGKNILE